MFKIFVEEHTLERDLAQERHMMARITIYQPQLADNYIGDFYLDHDYMQGRTGEEGRRCRWVIPLKSSVKESAFSRNKMLYHLLRMVHIYFVYHHGSQCSAI